MNPDLVSALRNPLWAALAIFVLVAASSWALLMVRYRLTGRLFGSKRASLWTAATILLTSAASTVLGVFVPYVTPALPPLMVGGTIAVGASGLLAVPLQSQKKGKPLARHAVTTCLTVGIAIVRERLEQRLLQDREDWARRRFKQLRQLVDKDWCSAVDELFEEAKRRARSHRRDSYLPKLRAHHDKFKENAAFIQSAEPDEKAKEHLKEARGAERELLELLYLARYDDLVTQLIRDHVPG